MFSIHNTPAEIYNLETQQLLPAILRNTRQLGEITRWSYSIDFEKLRLQNIFRLLKAQSRDCKNSPSMKSVLEKLRFRDGLVYTLGLTVEKKNSFWNSSCVWVWTGPRCWRVSTRVFGTRNWRQPEENISHMPGPYCRKNCYTTYLCWRKDT